MGPLDISYPLYAGVSAQGSPREESDSNDRWSGVESEEGVVHNEQEDHIYEEIHEIEFEPLVPPGIIHLEGRPVRIRRSSWNSLKCKHKGKPRK